jgi:hypothetical protein
VANALPETNDLRDPRVQHALMNPDLWLNVDSSMYRWREGAREALKSQVQKQPDSEEYLSSLNVATYLEGILP